MNMKIRRILSCPNQQQHEQKKKTLFDCYILRVMHKIIMVTMGLF